MSNPLQHTHPLPPVVGGGGDPKPLLRRWLRRGDLAFDIGANVGDRTREFLLMGCRVIAVEPQAEPAQFIPPEATVVRAAVAAETGSVWLYPSPTSYVSTTIPDYREKVQTHVPGGYIYTDPYQVEAVTLDNLIGRYGEPAFCKIDVEGAEYEVLRGLTRPLEALSFEVHDFDRGKLELCVERLQELEHYEFAYSPMESFELSEGWPPARLAIFGDVYAWLQ